MLLGVSKTVYTVQLFTAVDKVCSKGVEKEVWRILQNVWGSDGIHCCHPVQDVCCHPTQDVCNSVLLFVAGLTIAPVPVLQMLNNFPLYTNSLECHT